MRRFAAELYIALWHDDNGEWVPYADAQALEVERDRIVVARAALLDAARRA